MPCQEFHHEHVYEPWKTQLSELENGVHHFWTNAGHQVETISVLDGIFHCEDGPAIITTNGTKKWFLYGKEHREDGPAVIWHSGRKEWYRDGRHHRYDGPAVIEADGSKAWYLFGHGFTFNKWIEGLYEIDEEHATMMKLEWG